MTIATTTEPLRKELKALLSLGGPLIVNYLAIAGIHFSDTVMAGRLGANELAAVAVGGSVWMLGFMFSLGIMMSISPIVSRYFGSGQPELIGRYTRQGLWLSQIIALSIVTLAHLYVRPVLSHIGIDIEFRETTIGYVEAIMFGMPAISAFLVFRFTTEGIGATRPIMYASLFSLVSNVFGNWVLMYGNLGAPALGAVGCGYSSAITMWLMAIGMGTYIYRNPRYRPLGIFTNFGFVRWPIIREMLSLGLPITVTITAETGLFSAVAILTGTIGAQVAAAHQIAINFAATMFMIPLGISSATTVRVGHELGAGNLRAAGFRGWTGIATCGVFMLCSAVFLLAFRDLVVGLYTNDTSVREIAISLLLMAAFFQVADGVQIGAAAALRGYKDTRLPMVINTFAYWVLAFPMAYLAAVTYRLPPRYIWGGFVIGLSVAAVLLSLRFRQVVRRALNEPHWS